MVGGSSRGESVQRIAIVIPSSPPIEIVEAIAAGLGPISHDEGGSKEILPIEFLRPGNRHESDKKMRLA